MRTVWKYPLGWASNSQWDVLMPLGTEPRHVGFDASGELCLWAEVTTDESLSDFVKVTVIGTGHELHSEAGVFLNTFFVEPAMVFHAYYNLS